MSPVPANPFAPVTQPIFVPYAPSQPADDVFALSDSMLAMKLQQEENQARHYVPPTSRDQTLAYQLATADNEQQKQKRDREAADAALARRLVLEEQERAAKTAAAEQERKRVEEAKKAAREANRKKLQEDEALALKLAEEEKKQLQLRLDYDLARKLDSQEKAVPPPPPPMPFVNTPYQRTHAVQVHDRYCYCGNTQTWNNNHIYNVHQTNCGCTSLNALGRSPSNHGRQHVHDYRCCAVNHIHTDKCYCVYRSHRHNHLCCTLRHVHNDFCNCTNK